jgi:pteridine reductase
MELGGKTVLVTGAARRVGRAIAEELSEAGARVVAHHHSSPGKDGDAVRADLRDPAAAQLLVDEAVLRTGRPDALVNSAAGYGRTPLDQLSDDEWRQMMALNLDAPMRLMRAAVPAGVRAIVNIVDVGASQPWPNYLAYSTSKAALLHLSRCLALELAPKVRVNCVAPGTVAFPEDWDETRKAAQLGRTPLGREGSPADVARAVRFLIENDYLTGVCLPVDGGAGLR